MRPGARTHYFFHMDSWRLNLIPGYWLPTYIYSEEGDFSYGSEEQDGVQGAKPHLGLQPEEVGNAKTN